MNTTNKPVVTTQQRSLLGNIAGWVLALLFFAIGLINTCWGNDFEYGVFIVLLSVVFLPPVQSWVKKTTGFTIPLLAKIILALFILWSALGVGELFDKIKLMLEDLR